MPESRNFLSLIRENKTLFVIITVGLFLVELEIFAIAAVKSGRKSRLQVADARGTVIYETDGSRLSEFNRYYFEKTFGPVEDYNFRLVTRDVPFPFRAWFVSALGIPIGAVLLFGFVLKACAALIYGDRSGRTDSDATAGEAQTRLEKMLQGVGRLNIFTIGFILFVGLVSYWVIPNTIAYLGKAGLETLYRNKWVFLILAGGFTAIVMWILYLRYLLAKKAIESQAEVDKYRLQLEYRPPDMPMQIAHFPDTGKQHGIIRDENPPEDEADPRSPMDTESGCES